MARIASSISSTETLPSPVEKPPCSDQNRQHHCCGIHQQTGRVTFPSFAHAGSQTDHVEQHQSVVTESYSHSRSSELGSRLNVQGKPAVRGLDPAPTCGDPNLDPLWPATGRSVCLEGERSVSTVFLPEGPGGSASGRRISSQLATCSALCVPSAGLNFSHSNQSERERANNDIDRPKVDEVPLVSGDCAPLVERTLASPSPTRPSLPSQGGDFSPSPRAPCPVGLARERLNLSTAGLPQGVIATIQSARAPSTRSLYENKWRVFEEWCGKSHTLSFQCSVTTILSFLQELLDKGKAFSTIKVYLAAISACHVGFVDGPVSHHPLVCRFMKGARRLHPVSKPLVPTWDLSLVLGAVSQPPFEPLNQVEIKILSLKTALLLALASAKRVSDIHALSIHKECTRFTRDNSRVTLRPNLAFVPKNPYLQCTPLELEAFCPPPFSSPEQERLHALCPVRALCTYIERTKAFRRSDQLFVSWAKPHLGKPVSKQRISHWIVEAIQLAYSSTGLPPPEGLRAHSTRGMATSWALFRGVSIEEICAAASWASPLTFARFYRLDVTAPSLAHTVLSVGPHETS